MSLKEVTSLPELQQWALLNHVSHKVVYIIGALVISAFIMLIITKKFRIPSVVGYVFLGMLFSRDVVTHLPFLSPGQAEWYTYLIDSFNYVTILAVSFISFTIGTELAVDVLKRLELEFAAIVFLESIGSFLLVFFSMYWLGQPIYVALVLGAIAAATAPAATVLVLKEYSAKGELAATLLVVLALDEALALIIFGFAESIALIHVDPNTSLSFYQAVMVPGGKILGAILLGLNVGYFSQKLMHFYHQKGHKILLLLATVFGISAVSIAFDFSPLIANLAVGFAYRNFSDKYLGLAKRMDTLTVPLYAIFFILAGTHIRFSQLLSSGFLITALVYFVTRSLGKIGGASLGAWISEAPAKVKKYIGLGLLPQAGVAIDLAYAVQRDFVHLSAGGLQIGNLVFNVLLFTMALTEIVGPLLTEYALSESGEMKAW